MISKKRGVSNLLFSNPRSRSAQATIFVILALAIVLTGLIYFYYNKQSVEKEIEVVQPEIVPIKLYVDNCVKSVTENGLGIIGLSGGYINISDSMANDQRTYLTTFPGIGFKIPYWWHDGVEAVPTEEFIKQQLASHIQSELKKCINKFEPFHNIFEINELKEPIVDVNFNENDVSVDLNYQLEVIAKDGNFKGLVEHFKNIIPIRFKKVYEFAKLIMDRENKDYFLEKKTIDLYTIDRNIPTTDVEATCKSKVWLLSSIKEEIKNLLRVNLPYVRIIGTDYNPNQYVPNPQGENVYSATYFQQHYLWYVDENAKDKYKNMKIAFAYENWPMQVYARPNDNGILRSNSQRGTDMLSFLCLHIWHFTYDINYPVLVTITDKETDKNKEYKFSFPFKVAVDHNQPKRDYTGTALFDTEPDLSSEDFCNDVRNEITIFTVDNATGDDIRDVNLTFICGRYYCGIGQSNWLSLGAAAGMTKRLPFCVNGIIKGNKQGYSEAKTFIQTNVDGRSYVLGLNPMKEFTNFKVVKHPLSNLNDAKELEENEKASISVKSKDGNFGSYASYPQEAGLPLTVPNDKDATYDVDIYLSNGDDLTGGYSGEWKVSKSALRGATEIVFHVLDQGPASEDERVLFISGLNSYSKKVPQPELK